MKILVVREHFNKGKPEGEAEVTVLLAEKNEEVAFGFARILNDDGTPKFKMLQAFSDLIRVTEDLSVPSTQLNGQAIFEICEHQFSYGDVLVVHYIYEDENLISRDTVVLVPEETPAQYCV